MTGLVVPDVTVLVMSPGETPSERANARGHLFERFVAKLLNKYGFEEPRESNLNVTAEGIEIDVVARHNLMRGKAIAECKAYSRTVEVRALTSFYGSLWAERLVDSDTFGLMVVLPRLTPEGEEKARAISRRDSKFRYLNAEDVAGAARELALIVDEPRGLSLTSDPALIITPDGEFAASLILDEFSRRPVSVAVWAASGPVPQPTIELIQSSDYAAGTQVIDVGIVGSELMVPERSSNNGSSGESLITTVMGSRSDFEYQLPASPRYFVGRKALLSQLSARVGANEHVIVFNAKSGWGKSSLALKLGDIAATLGGYALILDSRTATNSRYIVEAVRRAATEAAGRGLLTLPEDAAWATLSSALRTIAQATWISSDRPLLVFFDQFENVFRDPELTREFRDLAARVRELPVPLLVGFAWKTDLVGWTEGHPYQFRNEIRDMSALFTIEPFGPSEVNTLLTRLEKRVGTRLAPELKSRLREYSQGLPWLLKKLADHTFRELSKGVTQELLLAEALNIQNLFEADLSELSPLEHEVLRHIALYAPVPASEVTERYDPEIVQSLVNQRLVIQVGASLDTYWDTFREFLNTGRVPVEESYILRQMPRGITRLLPLVIDAGGNASVRELARALETSDIAIFNLSRDLRLLGLTAYESNRVKLVDEIMQASDRERELRRRVALALRKHRAFSTFIALNERYAGHVPTTAYSRELPRVFPAVAASEHTWSVYARVLLSWLTYASLVVQRGNEFSVAPEGYEDGTIRLLDVRSPLNVRIAVPHEPSAAALELIRKLGRGEVAKLPLDRERGKRDPFRTVAAIGAGVADPEGYMRLVRSDLAPNGEINPLVLRELLEALPGGAAGIDLLIRKPEASPDEVGETIRVAAGAQWRPETAHSIGIYWRGWARAAGITLARVPRRRGRRSKRPL
jgi:Restriction endonuclease